MAGGQVVPFDVWGQQGWCGFDLVGESHYAREIKSLFGKRVSEYGDELEGLDALVVHDPTNRHDRNAVGAWIRGKQVGGLPREAAARYAPVLSRLQGQGLTARTKARVYGRADPDFLGSVRLDLPEPHLMVPANLPPSGRHRLLPRGNAIQVTGEEQHLDVLSAFRRAEGECWAYASLHAVTVASGRSEKTVVEVRLDGQRVGQLTPKMSGELLPALQHCDSCEAVAVARALVKGNSLKQEVVLYAARAHEIPESWLASDQGRRELMPAGRQPMPPAGWYRDPGGQGLRWWDGQQWTHHHQPDGPGVVR